ncbi:pilin [Candidatus Parcubacteria bacterium]|nr:pilin [Candidatus Parcubacteria bacterium]
MKSLVKIFVIISLVLFPLFIQLKAESITPDNAGLTPAASPQPRSNDTSGVGPLTNFEAQQGQPFGGSQGLTAPSLGNANSQPSQPNGASGQRLYEPLTPLPGTTLNNCTGGPGCTTTSLIYLTGLYKLLIGLAGVFAIFMITWGGVQYMTSEAAGSKDDARGKISNAIWGLVLVASSYLLLSTIDPRLLNLNLVVAPTQQVSAQPGISGGTSGTNNSPDQSNTGSYCFQVTNKFTGEQSSQCRQTEQQCGVARDAIASIQEPGGYKGTGCYQSSGQWCANATLNGQQYTNKCFDGSSVKGSAAVKDGTAYRWCQDWNLSWAKVYSPKNDVGQCND